MNRFGLTEIAEFKRFDLGKGHLFWAGQLSNALTVGPAQFETLWQLHPDHYHEIKMRGRVVKTPRWQQAYGEDYYYTGRVNKALPIPTSLIPFHTYVKQTIDDRLNGLLLNWYDGSLGHYIGRHRDSTRNMVNGAPIVTISFGEERIFRLRPWPANVSDQKIDLVAKNGSVFVMPYETNLGFTHEVPPSTKWTGKRISLTFRAFATGDS